MAGPARLVLSAARRSNSSRETVEGEGRTLLAVLPRETVPLNPPLASPRAAPLAEAGGVRAMRARAAALGRHGHPPAARRAARYAAAGRLRGHGEVLGGAWRRGRRWHDEHARLRVGRRGRRGGVAGVEGGGRVLTRAAPRLGGGRGVGAEGGGWRGRRWRGAVRAARGVSRGEQRTPRPRARAAASPVTTSLVRASLVRAFS